MTDPKRCLDCRQPIVLVPIFGWQHVNILDNLDCEARG